MLLSVAVAKTCGWTGWVATVYRSAVAPLTSGCNWPQKDLSALRTRSFGERRRAEAATSRCALTLPASGKYAGHRISFWQSGKYTSRAFGIYPCCASALARAATCPWPRWLANRHQSASDPASCLYNRCCMQTLRRDVILTQRAGSSIHSVMRCILSLHEIIHRRIQRRQSRHSHKNRLLILPNLRGWFQKGVRNTARANQKEVTHVGVSGPSKEQNFHIRETPRRLSATAYRRHMR